MLEQEVIVREMDLDRDAAGLAEMWNASDLQWPGTRTRGVPFTARRVRRALAHTESLQAAVAEVGGRIAGFCLSWVDPDDAAVVYVASLNVSPDFQGRGIGRRLLRGAIDKAIEGGFDRVHLGTWPGNTKALPLYKKSGFFWKPRTNVSMENYIPTILKFPPAWAFFAKRDWYSVLVRELLMDHDDEKWRGLDVYTYHFEADGEKLTVWIDRHTKAITGADTDELYVAAAPEQPESVAGGRTRFRWTLTNKSGRARDVSLVARGEGGAEVHKTYRARLDAGQTRRFTADVDLPAPDAENPADAAVTTTVLDGDETFELSTALGCRRPVEISLDPEYARVHPGAAGTVEVQLRNGTSEPIEVDVAVAAPPELSADPGRTGIRVGPKEPAGLPVRLRADAPGVFDMKVRTRTRLDGRPVELPEATFPIFVPPAGGLLVDERDDGVRMEAEAIRVLLRRKGGGLRLYDPVTGRRLSQLTPEVVPPDAPEVLHTVKFDLDVDRQADAGAVLATAKLARHPGLVLRQRVTLTAGGVLNVEDELVNEGWAPHPVHVRRHLRFGGSDATATLPLASGTVREAVGNLPPMVFPDAAAAQPFAEPWAALQDRDATLNLVWDAGSIEGVFWLHGLVWVGRTVEVSPGGRCESMRIWIERTAGRRRDARRFHRRLTGRDQQAGRAEPEPRPALSVRVEPPVVAVAGTSAVAEVVVENRTACPLEGRCQWDVPSDWKAQPRELAFADLTWRNPARQTIHLETDAPVGPTAGTLRLRAGRGETEADLPLLRLGDGGDVDVRQGREGEQRIFRLDNGVLAADVTPDFAGTVSHLRCAGVEQLLSPFPHGRAFGWMNHWYGGIMPVLRWDHGACRLFEQTFEAESITRTDGHGIRWTGVRQWTKLGEEELRGLTLELETLMVSGGLVVKHILRLGNATTATRRLQGGWTIFCAPDGASDRTLLFRQGRQIPPGEQSPSLSAGHWAAAGNPETGRALVLVSSRPDVVMDGWGIHGNHLGLRPELTVPPEGTAELIAYLSVIKDLAHAAPWGMLKDL